MNPLASTRSQITKATKIILWVLLGLVWAKPTHAQSLDGERWAREIFKSILNDKVPAAALFMDTTHYINWIRMQPGGEALQDSAIAVIRQNHPEILSSFVKTIEDLREDYRNAFANGSSIHFRSVKWQLTPGVRHLYQFRIAVDFKRKRRPVTFDWVFEAAWVAGNFFLISKVEEVF
jgi:hypothetical protein